MASHDHRPGRSPARMVWVMWTWTDAICCLNSWKGRYGADVRPGHAMAVHLLCVDGYRLAFRLPDRVRSERGDTSGEGT